MISPKRFVVESNIPAAVEQVNLRNGPSHKRVREQEDITAWMEMQEEAELDLIAQEMSARHHRAGRRAFE